MCVIHILWEMRATFLTVGERSENKERADYHEPCGGELENQQCQNDIMTDRN